MLNTSNGLLKILCFFSTHPTCLQTWTSSFTYFIIYPTSTDLEKFIYLFRKVYILILPFTQRQQHGKNPLLILPYTQKAYRCGTFPLLYLSDHIPNTPTDVKNVLYFTNLTNTQQVYRRGKCPFPVLICHIHNTSTDMENVIYFTNIPYTHVTYMRRKVPLLILPYTQDTPTDVEKALFFTYFNIYPTRLQKWKMFCTL